MPESTEEKTVMSDRYQNLSEGLVRLRPKDDLLCPKGQSLETFYRPVIDGRVQYKNQTSRPICNYDLNLDISVFLMSILNDHKPQPIKAINATVRIIATKILYDKSHVSVYGSGALMSQDIVFTVGHLFQLSRLKGECEITSIDVYRGDKVIKADLLDISGIVDDHFKSYLMMTSSPQIRWSENLDFAVLKLREELDITEHFIIDLSPIGGHYSVSTEECLISLGYPGHLSKTELEESFSLTFRQWFKAQSDEEENKILDYLYTHLNQCSGLLVGFGEFAPNIPDDPFYLAFATMSSLKGQSGGPVSKLSSPQVLIGLTLGGFDGGEGSVVILARTPIIKECYRKIVLKS